MKLRPSCLLLLFFTVFLTPNLRADDAQIIAAVRAADDERVAATIAADPKRLDAIFSDQLHYAHSNGKTDTKASYTETLVSHRTIYEAIEYVQRDIRPVAPGVALIIGRAKISAKNNGQQNTIDLNFLAVWREENGHWRFLAWQSCKNPPPEPPTPPSLPAPANLKVSLITS